MRNASRKELALARRILVGAALGALLALVVGLTAVALAPDDSFGDLAAGAVTKVALLPAGAIAGALVAWRKSR